MRIVRLVFELALTSITVSDVVFTEYLAQRMKGRND